jgi:hypothetical protein
MFRSSAPAILSFVALLVTACGVPSAEPEPAGDQASEVRASSTAKFDAVEQKLFSIFAGGPQRGGDVYSVDSADPIENALKGYVAKKYSKDDPDALTQYTYKVGSTSWVTDTEEAGTVSNSLAWKVISGDIDGAGDKAKAKAAFDDLVEQGAVFGYDGFEESGCAAPTDFLLVIDPKGKKVHTIELTPCDES